jgi:hypothetical protein
MRLLKTATASALLLTVAAPAFAVPQSYATLTDAVDWSTAITAIMAVAALLAAVLVVRKGIKFVLGMIR